MDGLDGVLPVAFWAGGWPLVGVAFWAEFAFGVAAEALGLLVMAPPLAELATGAVLVEGLLTTPLLGVEDSAGLAVEPLPGGTAAFGAPGPGGTAAVGAPGPAGTAAVGAGADWAAAEVT